MSLNVRFRALTANSKQIRTEKLLSDVKSHQKQWAHKAIRRLQQYPPPPPDSRYERTGDLGAGWKPSGPTVSGSGIITRIINDVSYAEFVYGDEVGDGQAYMHRGRWITIPQAIEREEYMDGLRRIMKDAIQ